MEMKSREQLLSSPQHAQIIQFYPVFTVCGMLGSVNIDSIIFLIN